MSPNPNLILAYDTMAMNHDTLLARESKMVSKKRGMGSDGPADDFQDRCGLCSLDNESKPKRNWTQCDHCKGWYHNDCLKETTAQLSEYVVYHCPVCVENKSVGPSIKKRVSSRKRTKIDYVALNEGEALITKGLHPHIDRLMAYSPVKKEGDNGYYTVSANEVTRDFIIGCGFDKPIYIPRNRLDGIDMKMPANLSVAEVAEQVGEDRPIEVMDVRTQDSLKGWTAADWRDYYQTPHSDRERIRNVISLEISDTEVGRGIERPRAVRQLDVVDQCWPVELASKRKSVAKYCLMSVQDSYTDFHLDFAGTQVYYNVVYGKKVFLLFPPTKLNLKNYVKWSLDKDQNATFFPDYLEQNTSKRAKDPSDNNGIRVTLNAGDLMLIPSGWIHAVYTPQDSLVIGGNFLTVVSMEKQLDVVHIEKLTKVPARFSFPDFQTSMWFVAKYYMDNKIDNLAPQEVNGLKVLARYLQNLLDLVTGCCFDANEKKRIKSSIPKKQIGDPQQFMSLFNSYLQM